MASAAIASAASSATRPLWRPAASRKYSPCGGSGVFSSTLAAASARELTNAVWPPRCCTRTGWSGAAASRSARSSGRGVLVSSYRKPTTHSPGAVVAALAAIAALMASMESISSATRVTSDTPPSPGCECASLKPGVTRLPPRSKRRAPDAASASISVLLPVANTRLPATASASTSGSRVLIVRIRPLYRMVSGRVSQRAMAAALAPSPAAMNVRRLKRFIMDFSPLCLLVMRVLRTRRFTPCRF